MFLCRPCFENRMEDRDTASPFLAVSHGKCEDCGDVAVCANPPSGWLPIPTAQFCLRNKAVSPEKVPAPPALHGEPPALPAASTVALAGAEAAPVSGVDAACRTILAALQELMRRGGSAFAAAVALGRLRAERDEAIRIRNAAVAANRAEFEGHKLTIADHRREMERHKAGLGDLLAAWCRDFASGDRYLRGVFDALPAVIAARKLLGSDTRVGAAPSSATVAPAAENTEPDTEPGNRQTFPGGL